MVKFAELLNQEDLVGAMETSTEKPVLLFKHSTTCPISAKAFKQYQLFLDTAKSEDIASYMVKVKETRDVSNQIEADTGVKHESPQIFLVKNKNVLWHTSHSKITVDSIKDALDNSSRI